jgi:A/G-specific adenine glycosylase
VCPLAAACAGRATGRPEAFPVKAAKAERPVRRGTAWALFRGDAVLLVRRPARGLLGGMRALPADGLGEDAGAPAGGVDWTVAGLLSHKFTHFTLDLKILFAESMARVEGAHTGAEWWPVADLAAAGLPTLFARAAACAVGARASPRLGG